MAVKTAAAIKTWVAANMTNGGANTMAELSTLITDILDSIPTISGDIDDLVQGTDFDSSVDFLTGYDASAGANKKYTGRAILGRVQSVADAPTITPNADTDDVVDITAIAQIFTIAAPTGTPLNAQPLLIRILDDGTGRAITFNAKFRAMGTTLPTTTTASKTMYIACIFNTEGTDYWDVVSVLEEA